MTERFSRHFVLPNVGVPSGRTGETAPGAAVGILVEHTGGVVFFFAFVKVVFWRLRSSSP